MIIIRYFGLLGTICAFIMFVGPAVLFVRDFIVKPIKKGISRTKSRARREEWRRKDEEWRRKEEEWDLFLKKKEEAGRREQELRDAIASASCYVEEKALRSELMAHIRKTAELYR